MAGTASVFLGTLAVLGVLAFSYPALLTTAEFRARYPVPVLRALLEAVIGVGFLLGASSLMLRRRKVLGLTGLALAGAATLAGGGDVALGDGPDLGLTIGVDWFVLNVLLTAMVFVPLERAFPLRDNQTTFRFGWATDGVHFLVSHLAVQTLSFLTLLPATVDAPLRSPRLSVGRPDTDRGPVDGIVTGSRQRPEKSPEMAESRGGANFAPPPACRICVFAPPRFR